MVWEKAGHLIAYWVLARGVKIRPWCWMRPISSFHAAQFKKALLKIYCDVALLENNFNNVCARW